VQAELLAGSREAEHQPCDPLAPEHRLQDRPAHLPAAVAVEDRVRSERLGERFTIAGRSGGEKPLRKPGAVLAGALETRAPFVDVAAGASGDLSRARAERRRSMLRRVATVARYAFGAWTSLSAAARWRRRNDSWTTSSASLALPSIRYAIEKISGRSSA
jgi:hypothetical protein